MLGTLPAGAAATQAMMASNIVVIDSFMFDIVIGDEMYA